MLYLIGGSPRAGKSILADQLSRRLKLTWISTDDLRTAAMKNIPKAELPRAFPGEFAYLQAKYNNDAYFSKYTSKQFVNFDQLDAKTLWTGIRAMLEYLLEQDTDFILEGVHLLPELLETFKDTETWPLLRVAYLVKTSPSKILNQILAYKEIKGGREDWLLDNTKNLGTLDKAARGLAYYGKQLEKSALKYKFKVFNTESDFPKVLQQAEKYLLKKS